MHETAGTTRRTGSGRAWLALGRWGMAWRVALALLCTGCAAVLALSLLALANGNAPTATIMLATAYGPWLLGSGVILALVFGTWLQRFRPIVQAPLFGTMLAAVPVALFAAGWLIGAGADPCAPGAACEAGPDLITAGLFAFGLPTLLLGTVAYGAAVGATRLLSRG